MKASLIVLAGLQLAAALPQAVTPVSHAKLENEITQSNIKTPGGKVVKVRYGPYNMKAMSMEENKVTPNMEKPCSDCYITALQADLEDETGKSLNVDQGAWLHHMVIFLGGAGEKDLVCPAQEVTDLHDKKMKLPGSRIFASGNERTPIRINQNGQQYGIKLTPKHVMTLLYDLVNDSMQDHIFYITMTYEVSSDASIKPVATAWMDVTGDCGGSYVNAREGQFALKNSGWASTINGHLLSATGHGHDGVTLVSLAKNNQTICAADQIYGRRASFVEGVKGMNPGLKHISDTGSCTDFAEIKKGDVLHIVADYNTSKFPLSKVMGEVQELMGISVVYIAPAPGS